MRPDEIRKFDLYSAQDTTEHHIHDCAHLLREIAAQLAEQTEIARTALGDSHNLLAEALAKQEAERNERSQLPPAAESPQIEEPNHLVRVGQTLCGLKKWSGGNIDIDFGLKKGITTCVDCLRAIAIESRKLTKQPTPAAEPLIGLTTDDLVIGQEQEDAEGYQHKDQPAAEPPREKGKHRFLGGTCVDCGRPLDDICTANQQADLPKEQDVVSECAEIIKKLHTDYHPTMNDYKAMAEAVLRRYDIHHNEKSLWLADHKFARYCNETDRDYLLRINAEASTRLLGQQGETAK